MKKSQTWGEVLRETARKKPIPPKKKYTFLKLGLLAIGIVVIVYLVSRFFDTPKFHPIVYVSGKSLGEIKKSYPVIHQGFNRNKVDIYSFFEKDSVAMILFFFRGDVCQGEVIIPRDNKAVETYIHYLNKVGMDYITGSLSSGGNFENAVSQKVQGRWRVGDHGKITNVFMVSGEEENGEAKPVYFMNTNMELSEWTQ